MVQAKGQTKADKGAAGEEMVESADGRMIHDMGFGFDFNVPLPMFSWAK